MELSEEGVPQWRCCFDEQCEARFEWFQGPGNSRAAASQTNGVGVSIGDHKSVSSVPCGVWGQKSGSSSSPVIASSCDRSRYLVVKCTFHCLSVVQFAQLSLEIGQNSNSTSLNICETFSKRPKCHSAHGGMAEAMAEAGRLYHESAGAIKSKPEAERADAQEQHGPPYVHVWVAFLRSLAATRGLVPEHVAALKSYWESNVVKSAPVQLAAHVRHCRAKPCKKKIEGKEGWTRIVFCLDPVTPALEGALEAALQLQKGVRKHGPAPRGPSSEKRGGS